MKYEPITLIGMSSVHVRGGETCVIITAKCTVVPVNFYFTRWWLYLLWDLYTSSQRPLVNKGLYKSNVQIVFELTHYKCKQVQSQAQEKGIVSHFFLRKLFEIATGFAQKNIKKEKNEHNHKFTFNVVLQAHAYIYGNIYSWRLGVKKNILTHKNETYTFQISLKLREPTSP